ncbi:MAG TPA: HD domain-containing protein, partial [Steroidobacteraceae bacterium]|nr:HD domain-containing protein [Steroidobacteraceae bacterium]
MSDPDEQWPQAGRKRLILPSPIGTLGTDAPDIEMQLFEEMQRGAVFMMGDNPALPRMPEKPTLLDFYRLRFGPIARRHHALAAKLAMESGQSEKVIVACFLHDISNGALVRCDHGYWSAQLVAPYVDEEVAWAIRYHQPLRYFADESVGYRYPEA